MLHFKIFVCLRDFTFLQFLNEANIEKLNEKCIFLHNCCRCCFHSHCLKTLVVTKVNHFVCSDYPIETTKPPRELGLFMCVGVQGQQLGDDGYNSWGGDAVQGQIQNYEKGGV